MFLFYLFQWDTGFWLRLTHYVVIYFVCCWICVFYDALTPHSSYNAGDTFERVKKCLRTTRWYECELLEYCCECEKRQRPSCSDPIETGTTSMNFGWLILISGTTQGYILGARFKWPILNNSWKCEFLSVYCMNIL